MMRISPDRTSKCNMMNNDIFFVNNHYYYSTLKFACLRNISRNVPSETPPDLIYTLLGSAVGIVLPNSSSDVSNYS